jgi:chromodomain-helicase-DNA-binding protein 7
VYQAVTLCVQQEDPLSLTVPRQRRRRRRKVEIEAERAAKRRNLMDMVAQLRESHAATDTQNHAMDLTKVHRTKPWTSCIYLQFSFY